MILILATLWLVIYSLKHDRDTCRTNFSKSLAYIFVPDNYLDKHNDWFTMNLWTPESYQEHKLFKLPFVSEKTEWFLAKNVLTFLNDYWKFCEFWLMMIVCMLLAHLIGTLWLTIPFFVIGGLLHSFVDGSLFRRN